MAYPAWYLVLISYEILSYVFGPVCVIIVIIIVLKCYTMFGNEAY